MGEYFYKNRVNFTLPNFLKITSNGPKNKNLKFKIKNSSVLVPLGGGKDSLVTLELL